MNFYQHIKIIISLPLCLILLAMSSCGGRQPQIVRLAPLPERVCRVAVLPFINRTTYQDGNVLFYRIFISELIRQQDIDLIPEGDVHRAFQNVYLAYGAENPNYDQLRIIGDYLHADILMSGIILQMTEVDIQGETIPFLTIKLDMLDAKTGRTIMTVNHDIDGAQYRKIMHFGLITTITQLAIQMSDEILAGLNSEGFTGKCITE